MIFTGSNLTVGTEIWALAPGVETLVLEESPWGPIGEWMLDPSERREGGGFLHDWIPSGRLPELRYVELVREGRVARETVIALNGAIAGGAFPRLERAVLRGSEGVDLGEVRVHERLWRRMVAEKVSWMTVGISLDDRFVWTRERGNWKVLSERGLLANGAEAGDWTSLSLIVGAGGYLFGLSETCEFCCDGRAIPMREEIPQALYGQSFPIDVFACAACGMRAIPVAVIHEVEHELVATIARWADVSPDALRFLRSRSAVGVEELASLLGFSAEVVRGWESGAPVNRAAWYALYAMARDMRIMLPVKANEPHSDPCWEPSTHTRLLALDDVLP